MDAVFWTGFYATLGVIVALGLVSIVAGIITVVGKLAPGMFIMFLLWVLGLPERLVNTRPFKKGGA